VTLVDQAPDAGGAEVGKVQRAQCLFLWREADRGITEPAARREHAVHDEDRHQHERITGLRMENRNRQRKQRGAGDAETHLFGARSKAGRQQQQQGAIPEQGGVEIRH